MKKLWIFISLAIILVTILVVNQKFMFNPLLFHRNAVTYNTWSDYIYPSKIEYLYWDEEKGWTIGKDSSDKKEIKYIFSKLQGSLKQGKVPPNEYRNSAMKKEMKLIIRRYDSAILLQFDYYEGGNVADLSNGNFIKIPPDLKRNLLKRTFNY
ncbi:hypothetical protein [Bacillus sp. FJAT-49736]|uniref:hypothetical protein n=1 Tax=Bacillus sp. FJAT-49736 TaxID=2833582 RepID=UPI001BC93B82|nr:hypothetical protein [Bacillus sp. FJAT-49736]MBS4172854.1 hypothetical protein [Bacillus sp. FJAT-49736]